MADNLPAIAGLSKTVAPAYNAAAEFTKWRNERAFFEAQIKRNWRVAKAVEQNVPATIESLKVAARTCASMGLTMSPTRAHVYFIPRRMRKRRRGESEADYERTVPLVVEATPSYRGLSFMATNYAGASMVAAEVVYRDDHFRYFGPIRAPEHEPTLDNGKRNERNAIGAYAVVRMKDGTVRAEYVDAPTISRIREMSEMPNAIMWTKLWTEGWRKVPIRRICKTVLETSPQVETAVEAMNRAEGVVFPGDDGGAGDVEPETRPDAPEPEDRPRGMAGLGEALNGSQGRQRPIEEPGPEPEPDRYVAESKHPPGSIEYWCDQINGAQSTADLDDVRVAALEQHVDTNEELADEFRARYKARWHELNPARAAS